MLPTIVEQNNTEEQKEFLQYLRETGVVVSTVLLTSDDNADIFELGKNCVFAGVNVLAIRFHTLGKAEPTMLEDTPLLLEQIPGKEPVGTEISFSEFMGDGFDLQTGKPKLFTYDSERQVIMSILTKGFSYALLNPPYSLRFERKGEFASAEYEQSETKFFAEVVSGYLSTILQIRDLADTENLRFIEWSTDWTSFFDCGREWWGTFCWTVHDIRNKTVAFIAAASSD